MNNERRKIHHRRLQVAQLIKSELENILFLGKSLKPQIIGGRCSITRVEVTGDLRLATCYFIPSKSFDLDQDEILEGLNASKKILRYFISQKLTTKYSPEFRFFYDYAYENAIKVDRILN